MSTAEDGGLDVLLKRLHLANTRRSWRQLVQRAEEQQWGYEQFLRALIAEEVAHRQGTRLQRKTRSAHFPYLKTIDDFDFTLQTSVKLQVLGSFLSPDFVTEGRSLVLSGKPGRGKTHLAIAIAYRAIQHGFEARFVTAAAMIDELSQASREGRLREALVAFVRPSVLIVDEVGYLTYGTDAANVLFHVVNERHSRRRAMLFTTNKPLDAWGRVLHDEDLAAAIVDRILERGRHLALDGPSHRTRHLGEVLQPSSQNPARVSGIETAEFQEPTNGANQRGRHQVKHRRAPGKTTLPVEVVAHTATGSRGAVSRALGSCGGR